MYARILVSFTHLLEAPPVLFVPQTLQLRCEGGKNREHEITKLRLVTTLKHERIIIVTLKHNITYSSLRR